MNYPKIYSFGSIQCDEIPPQIKVYAPTAMYKLDNTTLLIRTTTLILDVYPRHATLLYHCARTMLHRIYLMAVNLPRSHISSPTIAMMINLYITFAFFSSSPLVSPHGCSFLSTTRTFVVCQCYLTCRILFTTRLPVAYLHSTGGLYSYQPHAHLLFRQCYLTCLVARGISPFCR